jgi:hypothetical protein
MTTVKGLLEIICSVGSAPRLYIVDYRPAEGSSVESHLLKRRVGGWSEMAANLEPSQLRVKFCTGGYEEES